MPFRDIGAITKKVNLKVEREKDQLDQNDGWTTFAINISFHFAFLYLIYYKIYISFPSSPVLDHTCEVILYAVLWVAYKCFK